jgi:hypothetical protein
MTACRGRSLIGASRTDGRLREIRQPRNGIGIARLSGTIKVDIEIHSG